MTPAPGDYAPLLCRAGPSPELTFDTFVSCGANEFVVEVAQVIAQHAERRRLYSPLYIYGGVGTGKTHLLSAMANATRSRVAMINVSDLEAEVEHALRTGSRAALRAWFGTFDILLVDDIQLCKSREDLQRELFSIINHAVRDGQSIVISSDVLPTRLEDVEERLLSRLGSGVILGLSSGDKAARRKILERLLGADTLPGEVLDYLAEEVTDSVRRLKASAAQVLAAQKRLGTVADVSLARSVLLAPDPDPEPKSIASLASATLAGADFKEMLDGAETEDEQVLALQIAVGERLKQLRKADGDPELQERLTNALNLLRAGKKEEAMSALGVA